MGVPYGLGDIGPERCLPVPPHISSHLKPTQFFLPSDQYVLTEPGTLSHRNVLQSHVTRLIFFFFWANLDWSTDHWTEWHLVDTCCVLHYQKDQGSWWNHPDSQPLPWRTRGRVWSEVQCCQWRYVARNMP